MLPSLFDILVLLLLIETAVAIDCYRCTSSQPGCGKELNIRLQRWHTCPETGPYGGENFCVKLIEQIGSDVAITRECLSTFRHSEKHREKIPTVQRQNYCEYGRNNNPYNRNPVDYHMTFCFCNDWNGCNAATTIKMMSTSAVVAAIVAVVTVLVTSS